MSCNLENIWDFDFLRAALTPTSGKLLLAESKFT